MKKIVWSLLIGTLLLPSCTTEESCDDTIIPQHDVFFDVEIQVLRAEDGTPVENYPVRFEIQKHFCDGDVGLKIYENGYTDKFGKYIADNGYWLPYTNEKDYVLVSFYAGESNLYEYSRMYRYDEVKNETSHLCNYTFEVP